MGYDSDNEEVGGGSQFLGFMLGSVNESGDVVVDYLDDDEKEHLAALADLLGLSLTELDHLSLKSSQDYDGEKAESAVDYFDINEDLVEEHDQLLPRTEYDILAHQLTLPNLVPTTKGSVFDDENYDEEEIEQIKMEHEHALVVEKDVVDVDVQTICVPAEEGEEIPDKSSGKVHVPLKNKTEKIHHNMPNKSMDVSRYNFEEHEEEAFLKGFQSLTHAYSAVKPDISESFFDADDSDFAKLKGSCYTAEPMKQDLSAHLSVEREMKSPLASNFYPPDQQDWEDRIVWGNSPCVSDTESDTGPQLFEPPVSRNSLLPFSTSRCHPQLLRLESQFEVDDRADGTVKNAGKNLQQNNGVRQLTRKLTSLNRDMLEEYSWLDQIICDPDIPSEKPKLILDLSDEQMVFEILDNKDAEYLRLHSRAMIVTRPVNLSNGEPFELPDHGGQFGWQDVASDKQYSKSKSSQKLKSNLKKHTARGIKVCHSKPALVKKQSAAGRDNNVLDSFAQDLENLLDAEECDKEGLGLVGNHESKCDKADGVKGLKKRRLPSFSLTEEEIENQVEAPELCRLLVDDDGTVRNKKKKVRLVEEETGLEPGLPTCFGFKNSARTVKQMNGAPQPDGFYTSKENPIGNAEVVDNLRKGNKTVKLEGMKKNDTSAHMSFINKKLKISVNGVKVFKEKNLATEGFVCGACGQLGHMRTNMNCPKYMYEDLETASGKPTTVPSSSLSQQKIRTKKLAPKTRQPKMSVGEASQVENLGASKKVLKLKFKCGSN